MFCTVRNLALVLARAVLDSRFRDVFAKRKRRCIEAAAMWSCEMVVMSGSIVRWKLTLTERSTWARGLMEGDLTCSHFAAEKNARFP
jgi:hypothetical protein